MSTLILWIFIIIAALWPLVTIMAILDYLNKLVAKPEPPAHVDTPVEAVERLARVKKMLAQAEASRLAHHH